MAKKSVQIDWLKASNGTWRYSLSVDDVPMMTSNRSFLTKHEARIEAEWLMSIFGYSFATPAEKPQAT